MASISIEVGGTQVVGKLLATPLAQRIASALPFEATGSRWGDEIYFEIPVQAELESPTSELAVGDIAYWPHGRCFCIFYGRTPMSSDERPVPASDVEVFARFDEGAERLKRERSDSLQVRLIDPTEIY